METTEINREEQKKEALAKLRAELEGKRGQHYWRTLDEVTGTEEFKIWFEDEFPNRKEILNIDRRTLLKYAGASLALAGLSGCRGVFLPEDKLVPYVKAPEELVFGRPLFYASAVTLAGYATGVLVEQFEGRPIKLEGNPEHPSSLGALDSISQAEILGFYDPDRTQVAMKLDEITTWEEFQKVVDEQFGSRVATGGAGIGFLFGTVTSPTQGWMIERIKKKYPGAKFYSYEPYGRANVNAAIQAMAGAPGVPVYDFSKAKVIVTFDGDFLSKTETPGALVYARQFARGRKVSGGKGEMNRLYAVEANCGLVGSVADHRFPVKGSEVAACVSALANALGVGGSSAAPAGFTKHVAAIAKDIQANRGASVIVAGEHLPAEVQQAVQQLNVALGNVGNTVRYIASPEVTASFGSITNLAADLNSGGIEVMVIANSNPVYTAPADLKFADALAKAKLKIHFNAYHDETSAGCDWHLPAAHTLEVWGDARGHDGTASIQQPIMAPLFEGRSEIEFLSLLLMEKKSGYDLIRTYWQSQGMGGAEFEKAWRTAVHNGTVPNSASPSLTATGGSVSLSPTNASGFEISFMADPAVFDGRYANNGWLQELPRPLTKVVWDNVVTFSASDAAQMGIVVDELVNVTTKAGTITGIAYILPGQPVGTATVNLGYGRTAGGTLCTLTGADGGGFNAYALRTSGNMSFADGVTIEKKGVQQHLASTQGHSPLGGNKIPDNRDVIRAGTLAAYNEHGADILKTGRSLDKKEIEEANLYPDEVFEWNGDQWGMTIDMNACFGCGACITACQAENNISVVGKEQVGRNREMHWIRTDRYYSGSDENPEVVWQPIACVHCEAAPCEPVCPVAATVHSHEGINQMVYNRCVGTRYCSNNCPYKVRRFNYLNYTDNQAQFSKKVQPWSTRAIPGPISEPKSDGIQLLKLLNNPDVTVRGRGVMEKCTYCVQRVNEARIEAKKAGRKIADGDVITACQQTCPGEAITFGNIADPKSKVAVSRTDPRSYLLLEELQTRPRTSHLAKLRNPNPEITPPAKVETHAEAAH